NRVMTRFGLRVLRQSRNPGLRALVRSAGLDPETLTAGQLSHVLAPRLNAVGRLEDAGSGLRLLLADGPATTSLAAEMEAVNGRRQAVDRTILAEAVRLMETEYHADHRAVVLAGEGWHPGVIGIVASRVVERIHRPALLIALPANGGDTARGSARSIPGFDLLAAVRDCGEHLVRFGGHAAAAGFDIRPDRIPAFRTAFLERARQALPEPPVPELRVDLELPLADATPELARYLAYAGPFGMGNPTPVFVARGVRLTGVKPVGDGRHLRGRLRDGRAELAAIGFRLAESHGPLARSGEPLDVAYQLQEDTWRGRRRVQAKLVDFRPAG
ncbi:MAG TPA: DHHA1 domain-containing protein, partial [Longimicrobiales bacterium]|nr:DHHA1 domain-containing protein [Longimicrobiales bacterium]